MKVNNQYGESINFEAAVEYMDDEIREDLHSIGYDTEQEFFNAYCEAHAAKFGEEWFLNEKNPTW